MGDIANRSDPAQRRAGPGATWRTAFSPSTRGSTPFHDAVPELAVSNERGLRPLLGDNLLPRSRLPTSWNRPPWTARWSLLGAHYAWAPHRFRPQHEPWRPRTDPDFDPFLNIARMGPGSLRILLGDEQVRRYVAERLSRLRHGARPGLPRRGGRGTRGEHERGVANITLGDNLLHPGFRCRPCRTPNRTDTRAICEVRGLRCRARAARPGDHRDPAWRTPDGLFTPHDLPQWNRSGGCAARPIRCTSIPSGIPRCPDGNARRDPHISGGRDVRPGRPLGETPVPA